MRVRDLLLQDRGNRMKVREIAVPEYHESGRLDLSYPLDVGRVALPLRVVVDPVPSGIPFEDPGQLCPHRGLLPRRREYRMLQPFAAGRSYPERLRRPFDVLAERRPTGRPLEADQGRIDENQAPRHRRVGEREVEGDVPAR